MANSGVGTGMLDRQTEKELLAVQRNEITEYFIYDRLAQATSDTHNRGVLKRISSDELRHHNLCNEYTCQDVKPIKPKIWLYYFISRIFGMTFGLKLMERGEEKAHLTYQQLAKSMPDIGSIAQDEARHERQLIDLIDDERLKYTSDVVRGLNVALVELTGALAGLTLAVQNISFVVTTGLIIGIIMSLSVAGTEYIATKSGSDIKKPLKSVIYAGLANIFTVLFLLLPYFLFTNIYFSLGFMILNALIIISIFAFYISVTRDLSVKKMFLEMAGVSLGVAALAFGIGLLARTFLHIHVL